VMEMEAPQVLHLATHGFFLEDLPAPESRQEGDFRGFAPPRASLGRGGIPQFFSSFECRQSVDALGPGDGGGQSGGQRLQAGRR